jgi:DNA-directed RNA polymerase specialized sigma24 family protein
MTATLLDSSYQYVQAKCAFETAILAARRKGWPHEEIARVTGLTVGMIETIAGKRRAADG